MQMGILGAEGNGARVLKAGPPGINQHKHMQNPVRVQETLSGAFHLKLWEFLKPIPNIL